jgi:hypothetical protein
LHLIASACQNQCGVNTFCTGDWFKPSSLTCSCFEGEVCPGLKTVLAKLTLLHLFDLLPTTTTPPTSLVHIGWILAPKTESCSTACADQISTCHLASQRAVNSKVELKHALSQAGYAATADALSLMSFCSFAKDENPSVILPAADKAMQYNGSSSTCAAVPSGDRQRLCCCSPTGCATSA